MTNRAIHSRDSRGRRNEAIHQDSSWIAAMTEIRKTSSDSADVTRAVDHLFRREAGRLVAILARRLGAAHLHLAEDVVQDALLRAMQVWPFTGVPENPSAWLLQTARNRAFDSLRRHRAFARHRIARVGIARGCNMDWRTWKNQARARA